MEEFPGCISSLIFISSETNDPLIRPHPVSDNTYWVFILKQDRDQPSRSRHWALPGPSEELREHRWTYHQIGRQSAAGAVRSTAWALHHPEANSGHSITIRLTFICKLKHLTKLQIMQTPIDDTNIVDRAFNKLPLSSFEFRWNYWPQKYVLVQSGQSKQQLTVWIDDQKMTVSNLDAAIQLLTAIQQQ